MKVSVFQDNFGGGIKADLLNTIITWDGLTDTWDSYTNPWDYWAAASYGSHMKISTQAEVFGQKVVTIPPSVAVKVVTDNSHKIKIV